VAEIEGATAPKKRSSNGGTVAVIAGVATAAFVKSMLLPGNAISRGLITFCAAAGAALGAAGVAALFRRRAR